ncbi:MAG TPA: HNH endonuclease [Flavipsychrobacter sp.]|nr:HNH endonuclease [Flavipsychrobacter sp.]
MPARNLWTREELILALNLYIKLPFGKLHSRTSEIIHLANIIGRNANAVAMRLNNFAAVDPYHQRRGIKGLQGGIKQVQPIWDAFVHNKDELLFESEKILAGKEQLSIEKKYASELHGIEHLKGEYKIREVRTRVNQNVFRQIVLANYEVKCAITGINIPDLLLASHILPWSKYEKERLNPENGICLSALYDRAFDKGYIGISAGYEVMVSPQLRMYEKEDYYAQHFASLQDRILHLPKKYLPRKEFLEWHSKTVFKN